MNFTAKRRFEMKRYLLCIMALLSSAYLLSDDIADATTGPFNAESVPVFNNSGDKLFQEALDMAYNSNINNNSSGSNNYNGVPYCRIGRFSDEDSFDVSCVDNVIAAAPVVIKKIIINLLYPPKNKAALPKRLLLVGKPGTGKTTLAKAIAYKCGYDYYVVEAPFLLNEYKNSGPQNLLREIYPLLTAGRPVVVILDELTELTDRYKKENDSDATVAAALWVLLDSCAQFDNVFFVGTSNKEKKDLPAQLQSRFDEDIVTIHMPHAIARKKMFLHHLKQERHKVDDAFLRYLVKRTDGRSAREIEKLVFKAIQFANVRTPRRYTVTQKDFERALKLWKPLWHPTILYQKIEPHIQPFFKTAYPLILQTIGLMHGIYSAERQQNNTERGLTLQALSHGLQEASHELQNAAHALQVSGQGMQREGLDYQKEGLGYQKEGLDIQKNSAEHQKQAHQETYQLQQDSAQLAKVAALVQILQAVASSSNKK